MKKNKLPLIIALLVVDVAVTVFLLVINIMMLAKIAPAATTNEAINNSKGLVKILLKFNSDLNNPFLSFIIFVGPLILLLAANIVGLLIYVKKTSANSPAKLQDLSDEQKEALRQELLKDLSGDSKAKDEPEEEAEEESEEESEEEKEKPAPKKKAAPKAKAKAEEPKEEKEKEKPTHRNYHVSKRAEDGKWTVKFAGGEKVIKLFDTQKEALEYTKKMAENQGGAVLVHASKGANKGRIKSK